jgi:hypothetical protein
MEVETFDAARRKRMVLSSFPDSFCMEEEDPICNSRQTR